MKRSTIWILTVVMAIALLGLLAMQIVYLEKMVESKKYYTGWIEGKTYIAGITNEGYDFFDEKGKLTGAITIESFGQAIQADEDSIICLKGIEIYKVSPEGQVLGSRELTVEEQKQWVKQ